MGIPLDELAVFERAWFALVCVTAEVAGALIIFGEESPLHAGREAGASAAPEPRLDDQLRDIARGNLAQDLPQCLVAARFFVVDERARITRLQHILEKYRFVLRHLFSLGVRREALGEAQRTACPLHLTFHASRH